MTVDEPWLSNRTRLPCEEARRPSPASMTPALTSSALNLPISFSSSVVGISPASDRSFAFTSTMTRIAALPRFAASTVDAGSPVRRTDGRGFDTVAKIFCRAEPIRVSYLSCMGVEMLTGRLYRLLLGPFQAYLWRDPDS